MIVISIMVGVISIMVGVILIMVGVKHEQQGSLPVKSRNETLD